MKFNLPHPGPNVFQILSQRRTRIRELLECGFGPEQFKQAGAPPEFVSESRHQQMLRNRDLRRLRSNAS